MLSQSGAMLGIKSNIFIGSPLVWFAICLLFLALTSGENEIVNENVPSSRLNINSLRSPMSFVRNFMSKQVRYIGSLKVKVLEMFARIHNKSYSANEVSKRADLLLKRKKEIADSQRDFEVGKSTFAMRENRFADMEMDELKKLGGLKKPADADDVSDLVVESKAETRSKANRLPVVKETIPRGKARKVKKEQLVVKSKDWRLSGCISEPINQKACNSCYAITTMSVVEAMRCIRGNPLITLSPQQIVDCDRVKRENEFNNMGCNNGWPTSALLYLQDVGVAAKESCYPYKNRRGACKLDQLSEEVCVERVSLSGEKRIEFEVLRSEADIERHVADIGPVVTAVETTESFQFYGEGIFDDATCSRSEDDVDHAIVIVGFGSDSASGLDYWIIKNSWGQDWGEGGYAKFKRGVNACSIGHWGWGVVD